MAATDARPSGPPARSALEPVAAPGAAAAPRVPCARAPRAPRRRTAVGEVRVARFAASPCHAGGIADVGNEPVLAVALLLSGRAALSGDEVRPGAIVAATLDALAQYRPLESIHAAVVLLLASIVPPHLRDLPRPVVVPPSGRTPAMAAFAALVRPLASGPADVDRGSEALADGLADLVLAILSEVVPPRLRTRADALRFAAHEHVEQHLSELDLGPATVAAAVGVSVRTLQSVFHERGTSVAKAIRERRLVVAARALRRRGTSASIAAVAASVGFGGADAFARAFRARFGLPPAAYRTAAAQ